MAHGDFDPQDKRPSWECLCCGKFLGKQGAGGDFSNAIGTASPEARLDFGYGSSFDGTFHRAFVDEAEWKSAPHIAGWICDECIVQRHARLRVRQRDGNNFSYTPLDEHPSTKKHVAELDFFGCKKIPSFGHNYDVHGIRSHEAISSAERARAERLIADGDVPARTLVGKLLAALHDVEVQYAKLETKYYEERRNAFDRMRQNAELLSAQEVFRLRTREGKELNAEEATKLHESVQWYEDRWQHISELWESLKEIVQINDEIENGHPVMRKTKRRIADLLEGLVNTLDSQARFDDDEMQTLLLGIAKFFDRSFMEIMIQYAERGYLNRWLEQLQLQETKTT